MSNASRIISLRASVGRALRVIGTPLDANRRAYLATAGFLLVTVLVRYALGAIFGITAAWMLFYPAVILSAWMFGFWPGLLALAGSTVLGFVLFAQTNTALYPRHTLLTTIVTYLLSGGCIMVFGTVAKHNGDKLVAIAEDRKRAQDSLAEGLEIFRGIFDNARGTVIFLTNLNNKVVAWNPGAVAILGWSEREASGKDIDELIGGPEGAIVQANGDEPTQSERWLIRKDGSRIWASATTTELHHQDGRVRGYLTIVRNMTERREYEELLRRQNEELDQRVRERTADLMQANAELEGFTYSVSHDMRAPLRGIVGNSSMLLEDYEADLKPAAQAMLRRLSGSALKMSRLVEDLLAFARLGKQSLNMMPTDLADLFREVVVEEREDVELELVAPDCLPVQCDPGLMRMVLQNLVANAVKYRAYGRPLHLELGLDGDEYFVRDNGIGFDMAYAHKLFQPFERLHRDDEVPGTGIGLANVKRIIDRHGGAVRAQGKVGEGATFWFSLADPGDEEGLE